MRRNPCPTFPGWPGNGDWIAQRPMIEAITTVQRTKVNKIIPNDFFCYAHRLVPVIRDIVE